MSWNELYVLSADGDRVHTFAMGQKYIGARIVICVGVVVSSNATWINESRIHVSKLGIYLLLKI